MNQSSKKTSSGAWGMALLLVVYVTGCGEQAPNVATITTSALTEPSAPAASTGLYGSGQGPAPVLLGTAGEFVILANSVMATPGESQITGNTGSNHPAGSVAVTPAKLTMAIGDMLIAYRDAAGRKPDVSELGAGIIGGMTLAPATYKWSTAVLIPTDVTLNGGPDDVWIFQIAQGLTQAAGARVILSGGALPKNVFWQVAGAVDIGADARMAGVILANTSITLDSGATANSRLLAQTAVVLARNVVTQPAP
jgi:hypothetical protein